MNRDTSIIIPVFNEGKVVASVVEAALKRFSRVVCVDDGSTDNSAQQIKATGAVLIRHPINLGQGAALQTGIEYALRNSQTEYFVTYDSDGQHRLQDVEAMLKVIRKGDFDVVLGSRFLEVGTKMKRAKRIMLRLAVWFTNATSGAKLTDAHNGLRVFNRRFASEVNISMPDMSHASEIVNKIGQGGYRYTEIPVIIDYTAYSMAKGQSIVNSINILFDVLLSSRNKR